jgi:ATP-dependent DNA helicase RecG
VDTTKLEEAGRPDMLFVTPSPVPASVALSVYGHLALTTLAAPSPHVDTAVYAGDDRADAYAIAREAIEQKQQVLLAFPLLRGADLLASSEARRMAETLRETAFPGARISIFHGALSKEERFRAFDEFLHRRADVLLATTHVENGPVIPNATVLIVEQAQEFDIVRLHQLRALVGQGARTGRCLLILGHEPDPAVAAEARARIDAFCKETDGWQVAELQAGWATAEDREDAQGFVWAEPARDRELLIKTRQDAVRLLALDPGLKRRTHRALLAQVRSRIGEDVSLDGEDKAAATPTAAGNTNIAAQNARRKRRRRR